MPAKSARQYRYIRAAADRGEGWAKKWVRKYPYPPKVTKR